MEPQDQAAAYFMERKGYAGARPRDVIKLDDIPCWYYVYELEDATLEIEVEWRRRRWSTRVTTVLMREDGVTG